MNRFLSRKNSAFFVPLCITFGCLMFMIYVYHYADSNQKTKTISNVLTAKIGNTSILIMEYRYANSKNNKEYVEIIDFNHKIYRFPVYSMEIGNNHDSQGIERNPK